FPPRFVRFELLARFGFARELRFPLCGYPFLLCFALAFCSRPLLCFQTFRFAALLFLFLLELLLTLVFLPAFFFLPLAFGCLGELPSPLLFAGQLFARRTQLF